MHPEPHDIHVEVPDFIPDDLLAEFETDSELAASAGTALPAPSSSAQREQQAAASVLPKGQIGDRVQRAHALLALLLGYFGAIVCTVWWWSLATSTQDSIWWWFVTGGIVATAAATLTLIGWAAKHLRPVKGSDRSQPAPSAAAPRRPAA